MIRILAFTFSVGVVLFASAGHALGNNCIQAIAPSAYWTTICSSADGLKLLAGGNLINLWISTNSGVTWMVAGNSPNEAWHSVASSADGTKLFAGAAVGVAMWISDDSGLTWRAGGPFMNEVPQQGTSVACSADGTKLVAAVFDIGGSPGGPIYLSPNSGITWTQANVPSNYWTSVASSADGSKLIAAANYDSGGGLYTSTNFGITWMSNNLAPKWVAASADGSEFVAVNGGEVLTTTNGGVTWRTVLTLPQSFFYESIAVSADGTELILGAGGIYISTNSGSAWAQDTNAPSTSWNGISVSADGSKLAGVSQAAGGSGGAGGIFFPQPFFTPVLNFTLLGGQPMLSWVVPSADFILQQNLDPAITKWLVVTNLRGANLRNLSGTVSVYPSNNWNFYRLAPR